MKSLWAAFLVAERDRFLLWLPVAMFAGVLIYFGLRTEPPPWAAPSGFAVTALAAWLLRRRVALFPGLILAAAILAGVASAGVAAWRAAPLEPIPLRAVILRGTVSLVEPLPDARRITVTGAAWDDRPPLRRDLRIRLRKTDAAAVLVGDEIQVRALLRPSPMPTSPGAWDLQRDAWFANRAGGGTALGDITIWQAVGQGGLAARWEGLRQSLAARVMRDLPGPSGAIAATLFTGLGGAIPAEDRAAFRDAGLAHLLAVAGLHIGAVMGAVFFAVRLLLALWSYAALRWPCKQIAGLAALLAGLLYLLITGAHVPIERSFAMAALVTLGLLTGRRALSLRGLALAATAIMLVSPAEAVNVSFQMSFSAVMALIAGYDCLRPVLARLRGLGWGRRFAAQLALLGLTSLLAGGASMPIAAYHFGQIQLWFIPANLIAVPLTALFALPAGIVALLLMPLGVEQLALQPMGWTIDVILAIARFVAAWPDATLRVPQMPNWGALSVAAGLCWLCLWRGPIRWAGAAPIILGMASIVLATPPDLLVSSDARLIALRADGTMWVQSKGGGRFTRDAWAQLWGVRTTAKLSDAPKDIIACDGVDCLLHPRPDGPAILLSQAGEASSMCDRAVLVVAAQPAANACPRAPRIDRFSVWRDGAIAVWLTGGEVHTVSDRDSRGSRPWVPGVPLGHGEVPNLPMAPTE